MTLEEKEEKINNAQNEEELEKVVEEIKADEKEEAPVEEKKEEEITPEEERSLVKDTNNLETRSVKFESVIERKGENKMEEKEFRNSKEYIDAYAEYLKSGNEKELRALLTTNGYATGNSATVAVPDLVYDIVKTAWEREELMGLVRTISAKGNMQVQFEVSADGATVHTEGYGEVSPENLTLGIVSLPAKSIKKWISISDEVVDLKTEEFLRYIYDELTYRIAKKCADELVGIIKALPQSLSANADGVYDTVSADKITGAPAMGLVAEAIGHLSDETRDITIVMNKLTYAEFKAIQYAGNYPVDPFEGARVVFNNTLPAYDSANANAVYMIVGDFNHGALANYPVGEGIEIKFDDTTLMTSDLVRILGRRFVGMNAVADKSFTLIGKPASV